MPKNKKKKFLNEKTLLMLFFDICETPKIFWPIFRHLPPCLWLYLKKFPAKHFKIIKYQCTIVTVILGVEFFFLWVTVQEHCVMDSRLLSSHESVGVRQLVRIMQFLILTLINQIEPKQKLETSQEFQLLKVCEAHKHKNIDNH